MLASGWIREAGDANLDGAKKLLRRHNALRKLKKVRCDTHTHTHPRELRSLCRSLPTRPLFLSLTLPPLPPPKAANGIIAKQKLENALKALRAAQAAAPAEA